MGYKYFCPRCGKETVYRAEYHGLCEDCYREIYGPKALGNMDMELKIKVCKLCGSLYYGGEWIKPNEKGLERIIRSLLKRSYKELKAFEIQVQIKFREIWEIFSEKIRIEIKDKFGNTVGVGALSLKPSWGICDKCQLKMSGDYWELIIRVRFRRDSKYDENFFYNQLSILNIDSSEDYVRIVRVKDGLDMYFTSREIGKKVLKSLSSRLGVVPKKFLQKKLYKALGKTVLVENFVLNI
ncbi:MAG: NMD3-related protein [Candidatus Njordarchaeia archaeon]